MAGDVGAGGDQRLVQHVDQRVGDLRPRLAQRQAAGVAGDLQRHLGRRRHDDGQRTGPEAPRQQIEAVVQLAGQFLGHQHVAQSAGAASGAARGPWRRNTCGHRVQVERVGHQRVQRVGGDGDHFAAAHGGGGALQHFGLRFFGVDLDQVGCHVRLCRSQRGPMASATSSAIW